MKRITLMLVVGIVALLPGLVSAQDDSERAAEASHILLAVEGSVSVSRNGWDILEDSLAPPATSLREGDFLVFAGSSSAVILCADLTLAEQFADGVVECSPDPENPAFYYADNVEWMSSEPLVVAITPETQLPPDTGDVQLVQLSAEDQETLAAQMTAVDGLGLEPDATVFVLASLYARYGLYYDAINILLTHDAIQCRDRAIVRPTGDNPVLESPVSYLRLGEWHYFTGDQAASERFFTCARQLANDIQDEGNAALAAARLGDVTLEGDPFQFYQEAIDYYAALGANTDVDALLDFCGSRNCTDPRQ